MARPNTYTRHPADWDPTDSLALALALENGVTMRQASVALGKTKFACMGHWRRLTQHVNTVERNPSNGG